MSSGDERDLSQRAACVRQRRACFGRTETMVCTSGHRFSPLKSSVRLRSHNRRPAGGAGRSRFRGFLGRGSALRPAGLSETGGRIPTRPGTETHGSPSSLAPPDAAFAALPPRCSSACVFQTALLRHSTEIKRLERAQRLFCKEESVLQNLLLKSYLYPDFLSFQTHERSSFSRRL